MTGTVRSAVASLLTGLALLPAGTGAATDAAGPLPEMIALPAGSFEMGGDRDPWAAPDELGDRIIDLPAFAVSRTEVTVAQYAACVDAGACRAPLLSGEGDEPVTGVSWRDAVAYADWLGSRTGGHYRLPSEAEWERVARAGSATRFWWGDEADPAYGNFGDAACCQGGTGGPDIYRALAPVASFAPTPEGIHDLYGNVWEWVQDCYAPHDRIPPDGAAYDPPDCRVRVLRGGSYLLPTGFARASARYRLTPGARRPDVGFRVAMDPSAP